MEFIRKNTGGYTFIEVLVAISIFAFVLTITTTITVNFYNAQKKERIRNLVIEETQFLLNRIANLVRDNTIDYAEYFAQSNKGDFDMSNDDNFLYGKFPKEYEWHFYYVEDCDVGDFFSDCTRENPNNFNEGYFDTFADNSQGETTGNDDSSKHAINKLGAAGITDDHEQLELYLINADGTKKTILRRLDNKIDDDGDGDIDEDTKATPNNQAYWTAGADGNIDGGERLGILELEALTDYHDADPLIDTGTPESPADPSDGILDFEGEQDNFQVNEKNYIQLDDFIPISPRSISITDLRFFISPLDDPRKAFSETGADSQIQPHVTIIMTVQPGETLTRQLPGNTAKMAISIQTTITSRTLSNVLFPDP